MRLYVSFLMSLRENDIIITSMSFKIIKKSSLYSFLGSFSMNASKDKLFSTEKSPILVRRSADK